MNDLKVLFLLPNPRNESLISPTAALFYSIFKVNNIEMKYFDTTFYDVSTLYVNPDQYRLDILDIEPYDINELRGKNQQKEGKDVFADFRMTVESWKPDVIMVSSMEATIPFTRKLMGKIKDLGIPSVLGGVFATYAPEMAVQFDEFDAICVGEGERVIVPIARKLAKNEDLSGQPNIWVKQKDGSIAKNPLLPTVDLDQSPLFDASIFEESRFYRPMKGKIYKTFPVETHRGCQFKSSFCNSPLQERKYTEETKTSYFRKKNIHKVLQNIDYLAHEMEAEYLMFWADNFLLYSRDEIDMFCDGYSEINLPFCIQTYPTTIDEYKIKRLCEVGLHRIGIGIEHGNEVFRRKILNRNYSNKAAVSGISILKKYGVSFSTNNIIGFPTETPELHMDTVRLNKVLQPDSASCSTFSPFHGTPLRDVALKLGFIKNNNVISPSFCGEMILNMPDFTQEQIFGKYRTFNLYISFPESRWNDIKKAEAITAEGDKILNELKEEFIEKYRNLATAEI